MTAEEAARIAQEARQAAGAMEALTPQQAQRVASLLMTVKVGAE